MTWAAVAIAGGAVVGGALSAQGSKSSAETQAAAQEQAAQTQMNMYNTTTKQEQPFMQSGYAATAGLNYLMGLKNTGYNNTFTPANSPQNPSGSTHMQGVMDRTKSAANGILDPAGIGGGGGMTTSSAKAFLDPGSVFGGLAKGGPARGGEQGRTYIVGEPDPITGEARPEILHMDPGSTGYVHPNLATVMRMGIPGRAQGGPVGIAEPMGPVDRSGNSQPANNQPAAQQGNGFMSQPIQGYNPGALTQGYGNFNFNPMDVSKMPGYQFQLQQGNQAIQNRDSSSVGALSGAATKDMDTFNQQLAAGTENQYYNQALANYQTNQGNYYTSQNNIFNRLSSIASMGQNAAGNLGSVGSSLGSGVAQAQAAAGGSLAGGQLGAANAYANAASNVPLYALMAGNQNPAPQTPGYSGTPGAVGNVPYG